MNKNLWLWGGLGLAVLVVLLLLVKSPSAAPLWLPVGTDIQCPSDNLPIVYNSAGTPFQLGCGSWPTQSVPIGSPNSRSLSLGTAYQATDPTKPALVTVNLTSTATLSLSGGTTNTADGVMGATSGVSGGTGSTVCKYANTNTGALTIGLNLSTVMSVQCSFYLPAGWYFAIRQTAGTVSIVNAFDQSLG